jgi:hypothetical protein
MILILKKNERQSDDAEYQHILQEVRQRKVSPTTYKLLQTKSIPNPDNLPDTIPILSYKMETNHPINESLAKKHAQKTGTRVTIILANHLYNNFPITDPHILSKLKETDIPSKGKKLFRKISFTKTTISLLGLHNSDESHCFESSSFRI